MGDAAPAQPLCCGSQPHGVHAPQLPHTLPAPDLWVGIAIITGVQALLDASSLQPAVTDFQPTVTNL